MTRRAGLVGLACLLALAAGDVHAEVELGFLGVNDFGTASRYPDDLYTAALGITVGVGRVEYALTEDLFTDSLNDVRFDETWLIVAGELPFESVWDVTLDGGSVHVGEGLFGESFQNFIHDILGTSDDVYPYIEEQSWHAVLGVVAERPWLDGERVTATVRVEAREAFGFKSFAEALVTADWRLRPALTLYGFAGPRYTATELPELEPWIAELAPRAAIGIRYKHLLDASYNYNDYGTEDHHWRVRLSFRF